MNALANLKALLTRKGYRVFTRDYELNIVGVRAKELVPATFDDEFFVFWYEGGRLNSRHYKGTTDPGTYYLRNPLRPTGTVIVREGQNLACWSIGKHKGLYDALVQTGPIRVLRDNAQNGQLNLATATPETATSGINFHRAALDGKSIDVGKWSAGCQVLSSSSDFAELLRLAKRHQQLYGALSYTLIDLRTYNNQLTRDLLIGGSLIAGLLVLQGKNPVATAYHSLQKWLKEP